MIADHFSFFPPQPSLNSLITSSSVLLLLLFIASIQFVKHGQTRGDVGLRSCGSKLHRSSWVVSKACEIEHTRLLSALYDETRFIQEERFRATRRQIYQAFSSLGHPVCLFHLPHQPTNSRSLFLRLRRVECSNAGVHRPTHAGIHADALGAYSICLSGGYDNEDKGDKMYAYSVSMRTHN